MRLFHYFCIFSIQKTFTFFILPYKELSEFLPAPLTWETFSACLIVLDNLCEVFGCTVITDFMSAMSGFSKVFDC